MTSQCDFSLQITLQRDGVMFWTDIAQEKPGSVERAYMDGTGREVLADNVGWANGITLDYARRVIIWIGRCCPSISQSGRSIFLLSTNQSAVFQSSDW